jgi:hypothetical protein
MSSLIKRESGVLARNGGVSSAVGGGMVAAGAATLPIWLLATMLPGGILIWATIFIIAGIFIY